MLLIGQELYFEVQNPLDFLIDLYIVQVPSNVSQYTEMVDYPLNEVQDQQLLAISSVSILTDHTVFLNKL